MEMDINNNSIRLTALTIKLSELFSGVVNYVVGVVPSEYLHLLESQVVLLRVASRI